MGYEMKLVTYEQTREDFFRDEMAKAEMQVRMWQARLQTAKNPIQEMEAHDNASNAAWVYNYYKDAIEAFSSIPKWISVDERLPEVSDVVLVIANGKPREHITLHNALLIASYWGEEGWIADGFESWDKLVVTHWMELPEAPKEG